MTATTGRRIGIIAGVVLLQALLLVAAFSLGVYVERYGFTRNGLSYAGPGVGGPPAGQIVPGRPGAPVNPGGQGAPGGAVNPQGNRPGEPGRPVQLPAGLEEPPQLLGLVKRIDPDVLYLATPDGPRLVLIDTSTVYEDVNGERLSAADLRPEMIVAIYGEFTPAVRNLLAARIVILPSPPPPDVTPPAPGPAP